MGRLIQYDSGSKLTSHLNPITEKLNTPMEALINPLVTDHSRQFSLLEQHVSTLSKALPVRHYVLMYHKENNSEDYLKAACE